MSVDIAFPVEFIVEGTAVSLSAKRRESVAEWKERVKAAGKRVLPDGYFANDGRLAVTLYYFPDAEMQGDIDNIVKPVLDAMNQDIYLDDRQVERVVVQKFEPGGIFLFSAPSVILERALKGSKPALYIRLSDNPSEDLI